MLHKLQQMTLFLDAEGGFSVNDEEYLVAEDHFRDGGDKSCDVEDWFDDATDEFKAGSLMMPETGPAEDKSDDKGDRFITFL